jgi:hypothetical protein
MLMPCLLNSPIISDDYCANTIQFNGVESVVHAQLDGFKPVLAKFSFTLDVNVHWLVAIKTVKKEPIGSRNSFDGWHVAVLEFNRN